MEDDTAMNELYLARLDNDDEIEFADMMKDWELSEERIVPGIMRNYGPDFDGFIRLLNNCHLGIGLNDSQVPSTLYVLKDKNNKILGSVLIRHSLTNDLRFYGGHIGYGIRPSERKKGLATTQLHLALEKARELGLIEVMVSCDKANIPSSKVIRKNGGILEWEGYYEPINRDIERYWIKIG
jgi:predicted acetyltransferase